MLLEQEVESLKAKLHHYEDGGADVTHPLLIEQLEQKPTAWNFIKVVNAARKAELTKKQVAPAPVNDNELTKQIAPAPVNDNELTIEIKPETNALGSTAPDEESQPQESNLANESVPQNEEDYEENYKPAIAFVDDIRRELLNENRISENDELIRKQASRYSIASNSAPKRLMDTASYRKAMKALMFVALMIILILIGVVLVGFFTTKTISCQQWAKSNSTSGSSGTSSNQTLSVSSNSSSSSSSSSTSVWIPNANAYCTTSKNVVQNGGFEDHASCDFWYGEECYRFDSRYISPWMITNWYSNTTYDVRSAMYVLYSAKFEGVWASKLFFNFIVWHV
jgi:hypothetical protein